MDRTRKLIDLTGKRFGKLTVLRYSHGVPHLTGKSGRFRVFHYWLCKCDCGKETVVCRDSFVGLHTISCGCAKKDFAKTRIIDLRGQKFGRLTVVKLAESSKSGGARWLCKCECGNTTIVSSSALKRGTTQSCGCYRSQRDAECNTKNGLTKSHAYDVWYNMMNRCYDKKSRHYCDYGGRGIDVCSEWHHPLPFWFWATSNGLIKGLELDRIDNNKGYSPDNCRVVSREENCNNTRASVRVLLGDEQVTVKQAALRLGVSASTIYYKISKGMLSKKPLYQLGSRV